MKQENQQQEQHQQEQHLGNENEYVVGDSNIPNWLIDNIRMGRAKLVGKYSLIINAPGKKYYAGLQDVVVNTPAGLSVRAKRYEEL